MAAEEDKKFDAVLGGFLFNDLRACAENLHCPESDVLAAYHERSLLPEETNSWKEHIVGCGRCQAVLAELEATHAILLGASEEASRKEQALLEAAAVAREERGPAPAKFPKKSRITAISRGVPWPWLAPAGALAAGLLVWVVWHENPSLPWKTPTPVKTARPESSSKSALEPGSPPPAAASTQLDQAQSYRMAGPDKEQAAAGGDLSAEEKQLPEALKQLEKSPARVRSAPVRPTNNERGAREDAAHDLMAAGPPRNQPAQEPGVGLAAAAGQIVTRQTETANGQMQAQQSPSGAPVPSPPAELQKKSKAESRGPALRAAAAAPPSPSASAAFNDLTVPQALVARAADLNLIVTPTRRTVWRAGHAGIIEFSNDGGASWSRQSSNVVVDLTAGSAPSGKVCWIVGRAGTILLTTDAGSHWAVLHSPLDEDLGGVRATDALHATIWNLGNTKVFETADGGVSWKPATSQ